jgi:hypothetical protein
MRADKYLAGHVVSATIPPDKGSGRTVLTSTEGGI